MKPSLPGLPTISALMLTAILAVWLGLWGPIDLSKLEKWQTLITGLIALIAAGIAYRGATAKVRFDQEVLEAEYNRRKLALYLKLEISMIQLIETAWFFSARFGHPQTVREFTKEDFTFEEPPELEEAWAFLDYFPREMISEIRDIRQCIRKLAVIKSDLGDRTATWGPEDIGAPWIATEGHRLSEGIYTSAKLVVDALKPLIEKLAPRMKYDEKSTKAFGEPEDIPF